MLHRALDIDKESKAAADVWNNLGLVALARRRDQEAFADFDQASQLDPALTVARRNKAMVYLDCGDYARAAEELHAVTHADPTTSRRGTRSASRSAARANSTPREARLREGARGRADGPAPPTRSSISRVLQMDFKKDPAKARARLDEYLEGGARRRIRERADAEARARELAKQRPPAAPQSKPEVAQRGTLLC